MKGTRREEDRRSARTRAMLRDALIELITELGWDDVSVQQICEQANVGRSTFYAHFTNKEALLVGSLEDLRSRLSRRNAGAGRSPSIALAFVPGLVEHAHEELRLFRGLIGRRSAYVVQQRFRDMVLRLVSDDLPRRITGRSRDALARWLAGAIVELLMWWAALKTPMRPAELASLIDELSAPILDRRLLAYGRRATA
jgi:AcrR family transcriptional regulator